MDTHNAVKTKSDLIVRASDFVVEHSLQDKFSEHYLLDTILLGEGAFGRV